MELTDGVVRLRPLREDDAAAIYATCNDAETQRWTVSLPAPYRLEDAHDFVAFAKRVENQRIFVITEPPSDDYRGTIAVRLGEVGSVGYMVAPTARRRGLATRALRLAARWALTQGGVERLEVTTHPDNIASQRVAEKAGFTREGLLRAYLRYRDGRRRDSVMFSLLPGDLR